MPRRQTTGVQRRARASERAMQARAGTSSRPAIDFRLLAIGAFLVLGTVLVVVFLVVGGEEPLGQVVPDAGRQHVDAGTAVPRQNYTSIPATSGPHWGTPANWGVYPGPLGQAVPESQVVHNLEHGGIVIWYEPTRIDQASIDELAAFVNGEVRGSRFKFILAPWQGEDFGHAVAVTAWTRLLYVDCAAEATATGAPGTDAPDAETTPGASATDASGPDATPCNIDMGIVRQFADRYYGRLGPEPAGGPGPPAL